MITLDFQKIIQRLRRFSFPEVDLVVGIGQGGLVPAALVAQHLRKKVDFIYLNYRDSKNQPRHQKPKLLRDFRMPSGARRILLVDDVCVSGATLRAAKARLKDHNVKTFVLKGQADYVLFPKINGCVNWPWKT